MDGVSLLNSSYEFCHPASVVSDIPRKGGGPMIDAGIEAAGAFLQAAKLAEDRASLILRFIEPNGSDAEVTVKLWADVISAEVVDTHENPAADDAVPVVDGRTVRCPIRGAGVMTLCVTF
jgi:alpha-mannosidase